MHAIDAKLVMVTDGRIGTLVMDAMDVYNAATKTVYKYCGTLKPLLASYLIQFESHETGKAEAEEKNQLILVLKKVELQLRMEQMKIDIEVKGFNENYALGIAASIDNIKEAFKTEIQHISDLKVHISSTETLIKMDDVQELRDTVIKSVQDLIAQCDEYRKRHNN